MDLNKISFRNVGLGSEKEDMLIARQFGLEKIQLHTGMFPMKRN